jgi:hypothetical protein
MNASLEVLLVFILVGGTWGLRIGRLVSQRTKRREEATPVSGKSRTARRAPHIVEKTGQAWKYYLAIVPGVIGSSLTVFKPLIGLTITACSVAFLCLAIRCPKCHAKWFWVDIWATRPKQSLWTQPECPRCHFAEKETGSRA